MNRVRATNEVGRRIRQAEVQGLPGVDQFFHGTGDIFDRNVGIHGVLIKKIDPIGAQSFQRCIHARPDVLRPAARARLLLYRPSPARTWWRSRRVCAGHERRGLRVFRSKMGRRRAHVKEVAAEIERAVQSCDCFRIVPPAVWRTAEANFRDFQALCAELALLQQPHGSLLTSGLARAL